MHARAFFFFFLEVFAALNAMSRAESYPKNRLSEPRVGSFHDVHRASANARVTNNSHNLADDINVIRFIYNR